MGTRGLVGFTANGVTKISYNHWDSYPSGLGADVVKAITTLMTNKTVDELKQRVQDLRVVRAEGTPSAKDRAKYTKFSQQVSSGTDWYATLRSLQGDVIGMLDEGIMVDGSDSGDWEYSYLINLDTLELVVVHGDDTFTFPFDALPDFKVTDLPYPAT